MYILFLLKDCGNIKNPEQIMIDNKLLEIKAMQLSKLAKQCL